MTGSTPSVAAATAPATISSGGWSPPRASTATRRRTDLRRGSPERLNVAAPVRLARGAGVMGTRRGAAVRAHVDGRHGDAMLGAALVAPGLGCLSLGDCHERPQSVAEHASGRLPDGAFSSFAAPII